MGGFLFWCSSCTNKFNALSFNIPNKFLKQDGTYILSDIAEKNLLLTFYGTSDKIKVETKAPTLRATMWGGRQ